jgi:hypothetical protein
MFSRLGPIDNTCDAPLYSVVKASEKLGFKSPLDVRWSWRDHALARQPETRGVLGFHPLLWLFGGRQAHKPTCACGQPLPELEDYTFTFASDRQAHYLLGQCPICRTMFWEEAFVPSRQGTGAGSRRT